MLCFSGLGEKPVEARIPNWPTVCTTYRAGALRPRIESAGGLDSKASVKNAHAIEASWSFAYIGRWKRAAATIRLGSCSCSAWPVLCYDDRIQRAVLILLVEYVVSTCAICRRRADFCFSTRRLTHRIPTCSDCTAPGHKRAGPGNRPDDSEGRSSRAEQTQS